MKIGIIFVLLWWVLCTATASAGLPQVPNADFSRGDQSPEGWELHGSGQWVDRQVLAVHGDGQDSSAWWTRGVDMEPGQRYHFQVRTRRVGGSGMAITGPGFANRDQLGVTDQWNWLGHVFRVPDAGSDDRLRVGHWQATGTIEFDQVRLRRTVPVYRQEGDFVLGEGEWIRGDTYHFAGTYRHRGSNDHRVLATSTASFNSDRWVFGAEREVVYRFALPEVAFVSAAVEFDVNYHVRGACRLEVRRDGGSWHELAVQDAVGTAAVELPDSLFPAEELHIRLASEPGPATFQVNRLDLTAGLDRSLPAATGETLYADLEKDSGELQIGELTIVHDAMSGGRVLRAEILNGSSARTWTARLRHEAVEADVVEQRLEPGSRWQLELALPSLPAGDHLLDWEIGDDRGPAWVSQIADSIPEFYRTDYGYRLAADGPVALWWCEAAWKVPRQRALPEAVSQAVRLEAARHDYEAAQVILRPESDLRGLTARASDLVGPGSARIPADQIEVLRVYYHFVQHPTDATGVRDWWPDALPPLDEPLDLAAGRNQPLWLLVYVPPEAAAGDYRGTLQLAAEGFTAEVPVQLRVWDFTLPTRNHLETAFGLNAGTIWRYHGLTDQADRRKVLEMYLESFAAHRISPYDPTPLDPIRVRFRPDTDPPRADVDFEAFDRAMSDALQRYGFTNFRLRIQGLGGGTFHERYPPRIGEYGAETPEYQAMLASYLSQLETHLDQRGWLDKAYVYWFDEPAPRDYDFVADGMRRLKEYAPRLQRMLTVEPGDNQLAGLVDIWCPVSYNYDHGQAERRRAAGERIWWYVCTGPKAPYCTLFIDHAATELRVWHWQAWQRDIVGSLVWQTNYWTSSAAFPDQPQDPYEDPMGYVSGYSTPPGVKRFWGNGDGRFLYPPLAAAVPGRSGEAPVIEPPVSSIRWEMLREGIEDYEFLVRLRQLIEQQGERLSESQRASYRALLEAPAEITSDLTTFATDPAPIYAHRRAVAEAIEELEAAGGR